jgi:hypothetical protein
MTFSSELVLKRTQDLDRVIKAHDLPADPEMAVAMFAEAIKRCVEAFGPAAMGEFANMFVDVWRHSEGVKIKQMLIETVLEHCVDEDEVKH